MNYDTWITYSIACAILSLIPGPSVLLITGQALTKNLQTAFVCIAGNSLGSVFLIALSLVGVGAILAASASLFLVVKWLGVAYLVYLGVCQIIEARKQDLSPETAVPSKGYQGSFTAGFFTALLNPKAIAFYMAFIPQFFDPAGNHSIQYLILISTSVIIAGLVLSCYSLMASKAQNALKSRAARRRINYVSGGFYLGGSALMATTK